MTVEKVFCPLCHKEIINFREADCVTSGFDFDTQVHILYISDCPNCGIDIEVTENYALEYKNRIIDYVE